MKTAAELKITSSMDPEFSKLMDDNFREAAERILKLTGKKPELVYRCLMGRPLKIAEVDQNFMTIEHRLTELEKGNEND